jgi:hypothetical protein
MCCSRFFHARGRNPPFGLFQIIPLQAPDDPVAVAVRPSGGELRVPLARQGLEALRAGLHQVFRLAGVAGIDARGQLLPDGVTFLAGCFQADVGIDAEREALLPAAVAILPAPPLAPAGADFEIQTPTIKQLDGFGASLGGANRGMG